MALRGRIMTFGHLIKSFEVVIAGMLLLLTAVCSDPVKSVSSCPPPEMPPHSSYTYVAGGNDKIGSTIEYKCEKGFQLKGEKKIVCGTQGSWTPQAPFCEKEIAQCPFPGHGTHSSVNITDFFSPPNTVAAYFCEIGFVLVGPKFRKCLMDGTWSERMPICAAKLSMNRHIIDVSPNVMLGRAIVDDSNFACSSAEDANLGVSYWKIDLLEEKSVDVIVLIFGNALEINATIYYGNEETDKIPLLLHEYNLTTWSGKTTATSEYTTHEYLLLLKPIKFRYLTVEVGPVSIFKLHFCELLVLSKTDPSFSQCLPDSKAIPPQTTTDLLKDTCYTFLHSVDATIAVAESKCHEMTNGSLVTNVVDEIQTLLILKLNAFYQYALKEINYWLGGHMEAVSTDKKGKLEWVWNKINEPIKKFYWGNFQPNMGTASPPCLSLSGRLGWRWDDRPCDEKLNIICQHKMTKCGYPDANPLCPLNIEALESSSIGTKVDYKCPPKYIMKGEKIRQCEANGRWSGTAPTCQLDNGGSTTEEHTGDKGKGGLSVGVIIAIIVGVVVCLLIIIGIIAFIQYKKKQGSSKMMKYSTKTESAETLDVDGKKTGGQNYASIEESK